MGSRTRLPPLLCVSVHHNPSFPSLRQRQTITVIVLFLNTLQAPELSYVCVISFSYRGAVRKKEKTSVFFPAVCIGLHLKDKKKNSSSTACVVGQILDLWLIVVCASTEGAGPTHARGPLRSHVFTRRSLSLQPSRCHLRTNPTSPDRDRHTPGGPNILFPARPHTNMATHSQAVIQAFSPGKPQMFFCFSISFHCYCASCLCSATVRGLSVPATTGAAPVG